MIETPSGKKAKGRSAGWNQVIVLVFVALIFAGMTMGGIMALHSRANASKSLNPNPPLAVNTDHIDLLEAYSVKEWFVGLLEPARQTRLSFERGGKITVVLFDEGDQVSKGDVVARLDAARLLSERRGLEAQVDQAQAKFELASVTLSRQATLRKKGWQSEQKYDETRFALAQISSAIRRLKAAIDSIDIDISKSELRTPYSGTIAARSVDEGTVVAAGTPVIDVIDTKHRRARVGISVTASQAVEFGQNYRLVSNGNDFVGRLLSKRPDLQSGTRTVIALFEVIGADQVLFGDTVELVTERSVNADGAWLPISALSEGEKGLWSVLTVIKYNALQTIAREAVEILHVEDGRAYVRGNLTRDSRIVINGTNRIIPGQKVALAIQPEQ